MSKLLIDDYPIQVLPKLAKEIGLNEAIFLQQVHYWLKKVIIFLRVKNGYTTLMKVGMNNSLFGLS